MIYSVHQPQYLPWLGFFDKIDKSDCFVFLDRVQYKHREFQNRNKIRTKEGWIWLTVPVTQHRGELICDVEIDNSRSWANEHLKSFKAWYSKAEFFDKHFPFFESVYAKRWEKLAELNIFIIEYFLKALGIENKIYFESKLEIHAEKTQRIIDIGKKIGANTYLSGAGGRDYLDEQRIAEEQIKLLYQDYKHPAYNQVFAKKQEDFIPYLSVADLLMNEGDGALGILRGCVSKK